MDNTVVQDIIKSIVKEKEEFCFEVLNLDNNLIVCSNSGTIDTIKDELIQNLEIDWNCTLDVINISTAYVVPMS